MFKETIYQPLFSLVQPLHTEMADKGALTVYTATHTKFLVCVLQGFLWWDLIGQNHSIYEQTTTPQVPV